MTTTKKQRSIAERVAAESPEARAAAKWLAARVGKRSSQITEVDFWSSDAVCTDSGTCFPGELGLSYRLRGVAKTYDFFGETSPGSFIQECVALLGEPES